MLEKCKISCVICCNFRLDYSEWWRCKQWWWWWRRQWQR